MIDREVWLENGFTIDTKAIDVETAVDRQAWLENNFTNDVVETVLDAD
ncbi:MAG: hypothetical protein KKB51_04290 [Candidatus Riflebacteria bacterium]|nr:hypothetical protein [Candidatus Riflebacteria bacterium]